MDVALTPARIRLDVGTGPALTTRPIALDAYARSAPDPIVAFASRAGCPGDLADLLHRHLSGNSSMLDNL